MSNGTGADEGTTGLLHPAVGAYAQTQTWMLAAQLIQLPAFAQALAFYCEAMTRPSQISWPADKIFAQKLRYIVCYTLIGNEARWRRDGTEPPTLAALQRRAPASARQVAGFVHGLRLGGYVLATRAEGDRRALHLKPAPALLQEIGRSPLAFLAACEHLQPAPAPLSSGIAADPGRLADWLGRSTDRFHGGDILFAPFPTVVHFTAHDCGYPLLTAVMGARYAALVPGAAPAPPLTYAALAERFRVSRQHIGNMLTEAERHGWFAVAQGGRSLEVSAALVREFETWAAGQMAHYRLLAEELLPFCGTVA